MAAEYSPMYDPPQDVIHLLTDVHCHPTDDPEDWSDADALAHKVGQSQVGRICAMSTSLDDQRLVAQLAGKYPSKLIPAFGYHPWFSHMISERADVDKREHYRSLLNANSSVGKDEELDELLQHLPSPTSLDDILQDIRRNLVSYPEAMLGEVGIDKVFRLPYDRRGWSGKGDDEDMREESGAHDQEKSHSLGRRQRKLTSLMPSIDHQVRIAKAQIALGIELGRNISFHCVRASNALVTLLDDVRRTYPDDGYEDSQLSKKKRKRRDDRLARVFTETLDEAHDLVAHEASPPSKPQFTDINLDLHSCALSAEVIKEVQKKHANVYVSFSLAINARQRDLQDQIRACDVNRLLIESDWHSADTLGARCWTMLRLVTDAVGDSFVTDKALQGEERYRFAARFFHQNWQRFCRQPGEIGSE